MLSLYMYLSTRKIWSSRVQVAVLSDCCSCPVEWSRSSDSAALMEATVACVRRWWHAAVKATMPHLDKSLIHSLHCMPLNFTFQVDWGKTKWNKLQKAEVERQNSWQQAKHTNQPPPALKREFHSSGFPAEETSTLLCSQCCCIPYISLPVSSRSSGNKSPFNKLSQAGILAIKIPLTNCFKQESWY